MPVELSHNLQEALRACRYVLDLQKIVCIFPEGQRSIDGKVGLFKKGAAILIKELDVKAVPVYIQGAFEAWPRTHRFPRLHPVKVKFGNPLELKELQESSEKSGEIYKTIAASLQRKVEELVQ